MDALNPPTHVRCEYCENPIGIDAPRPRLSWRLNDDRRGAMQSAYQVQVARSPGSLADGKADLWDSGKVASDESIHIEYAGTALRSRERCAWRVRTWDAQGEPSAWSEVATWEMGLLDRADWVGQWIASPIVGGPRTPVPAPHLRKGFTLNRPIASARLYATALGLYEFEINGKRVGDGVFTPGRTEYAHRVPYETYDVTSMIKSGENAFGAILGDGWYCGHVHSDPRQYYGDRPRLLAQLVIEFKDGSTQTIATDGSWKTSEGPIRSSDMLMGEDYDARSEMPGWSSAGFDDSKWQAARVFDDPKISLVARRAPVVRAVNEIKPIAAPRKLTRRRWIFDMGQNLVGRVRVKVSGPKGTTIALRHAEMLDKDGLLYTTALRSARATDYYTKKSDGEETYEPHFTFHGFRYVELKGMHGEADENTVTGIVLHSDTPPTGKFETSDPMINQLQSNIVWSQKGNFLEIPTDCPQRDERLGWTGDAQVFIRTAAFNMDVANFFTKWFQDMADAQFETGGIPSTVPFCPSIPNEGGPAWSDAAVICPWTIYQCYGDKRVLEERWPMMTKFMNFLRESSNDLIRADESNKWRGYGDWLSHNAETPNDLIGTAFFAFDAKLMSKMARVIGKTDDATKYEKLAEDVRQAWLKRYVTPAGMIIGQSQTAYVLALHFDLLPEGLRPRVFDALVRDIEKRGMHLSTGFVGTPYLLDVLTRFGRIDIAYALLMQKTFPSWLFPVTHGATTMWERWDGWTPEKGFNDAGMNSYNHYAYGAVGAWMYSTIAGIELEPATPAYKHIVIQPHPGGGFTHAKASLESPFGKIESAWRVEGGMLNLEVTIPANTKATLRLPTADGKSVAESGNPVARASGVKFISQEGATAIYELGAGRYAFVAPTS